MNDSRSNPNSDPSDDELLELLLDDDAPAVAANAIPRRGAEEPLELSFAQQRMWFLHELEPTTGSYNISAAVRLHGPLDLASLTAALILIVDRHEVLRTAFPTVDGQAHAERREQTKIPIEVIETTEDQIAEHGLAASSQPFDLAVTPLLRLTLLRIATNEHVAILVMHHIVSDAWSMDNLVKELGAAYAAKLGGTEPDLPPLPIQYGDFAAWQRQRLDTGQRAAQLAYWQEQLQEPPELDLPTDFIRPAKPDYAGATVPLHVPAATTQRLRTLMADTEITFFATVLAAAQGWLSRLTGQTDLVLGAPVANRGEPGLEPLIGFFVNTLALRGKVEPSATFRQLLDHARQTALDGFAHQDVPFEDVVAAVAPSRDVSRNPLFQVMLTADSTSDSDLTLGEMGIEAVAVPTQVAKFDLTLSLQMSAEGITGGLEFATALFKPETAERLAAQFLHDLGQFLAAPDTPFHALPRMAPEVEAMVASWEEGPKLPYPATSIAAVFAEAAKTHPTATALSFAGQTTTYQALDQRADQLAHVLREHGVTRNVPVGVFMERSEELVVTLLGVLKAGGAYLAIDPSYPADRIHQMVTAADCPLIITDTATVPTLPKPPATLRLSDVAATWSEQPTTALTCEAGPDDLAYISFTSGSTGTPKGVAVPHRAVMRLIHGSDYATLSADEVLMLAAPIAFDASTFELWGSLLHGARLVIMPPGHLSLEVLGQTIRREQVTTSWLTTGLYNLMVDERIDDLRGLKQLLTGGDVHSMPHATRALTELPDVRLINGYGPTENTTFTTCHDVTTADLSGGAIPIGKPIGHTRVLVLDDQLRRVPPGVTGELYTGGDGLARGYIGQPELTAEVFVDDPTRPGKKLYRTGDMVRWRQDGRLEFRGRRDRQIKIRGHRIELAEVETALATAPGVTASAVVVQATPHGKQLIGYVAPELDVDELRATLTARVPEYLVPSMMVALPSLPLNANGKVDRSKLPAPVVAEIADSAPRTPTERQVAAVWAGVLAVPEIGVQANYFNSGGDSIGAIQVASRLRRAGFQVAVADLFQFPTVASLATHLDRTGSSATEAEHAPLTGPVPPTPAQAWFLRHFGPDCGHFNQAVLLTPQLPLDRESLQTAVDAWWRQHDALRTIVGPAGLEILPMDTACLVDVVAVETETERLGHTEQVQAGFDLRAGPLVRIVWYQLPTTQRLLIAAHHLVVDGVSWRVLVDDLSAGLRQAQGRQAVDLGPRPLPIKAWVDSIHATDEDCNYWTDLIASTADNWPAPNEEAPNRFVDTKTLGARLSPEATQELLTQSQRAFNTEVEDMLLWALARALTRWHGGEETQVLMEGHGRESRAGVAAPEDTVGWFTSLYPFRLALVGDDPLAQLKALKEARRAVPHHGNTFGPLAFADGAEALDQTAKIPLSFNYLGRFDDAPDTLLAFAPESAGTTIGPDAKRLQEIDAGAAVTGGAMGLTLTCGAGRYATEQIQQMLDDWQRELEEIAALCSGRDTIEATPADFTSRLFQLPAYEALLAREGWDASAVEDVARLSPMQAGLLFESVLDETSRAYFVQVAYRLRGPLDPTAFARAWKQLAARHPILRTSFLHDGGPEPLQIVWRERPPPIEVIDLRALSPADQQARIAQAQSADLARPLDLAHDSMWRVTLWQLADDVTQVGWSYHHVLLDGWSLGLVHRDLFAFYAGENPMEPAVPYRDYVRWLEQREPAVSREFWTDYLADYEGPATIPREPQPIAASAHAEYDRELSRELSDGLRELAAKSGATLATVMQAAWGILLSRLNRTNDVVFGAIVSGRPASLPGVERIVGLFICAVPVRVRCAEATAFAEVIAEAQASALAAEPHHQLPLAEIQTLTPLGRELFDHLLVFENYPLDRSTATDARQKLEIEHVEAHDRTHYEFDLTIDPSDSLTLRFGHDQAVFGADQIERLADRFETLLTHLVAQPDAPVRDLADVPTSEATTVLQALNQNTVPCPTEATLVDLLVQARAQHAGEIAVVQGAATLTYAELHDRADALGAVLHEHGAGPEVMVGVYADRTPAMIVAVLGVLKAGAAYVPLDPLYPAERLQLMLDDSEARLIVTNCPDAELIAAAGNARTIIDLATLPPKPAGETTSTRLEPHHLAYLIYTSGSTGRPKGVAVEHRSLVNAAVAWCAAYHLDRPEKPPRILQMASLSFDVFMGDFVRALVHGGSLVICDADTRIDPAGLVALLQEHRITQFESTPGLILPLMAHVATEEINLPDLELLILGSDTLRVEDYRQLVQEFGAGRRILNSYGVTEATIDTCCYEEPDPGAVIGTESTPIGKPLANQQMYVLDPQARPTGIGVPGELFIGGAGVARGYHRRPDLTAERFPTLDLGDGPQRLYRTGDLARWRADGTLEFLGRGDRQVKIRGVRVEPGEIEAALRELDDVTDAVVEARPIDGTLELVAYVVAAQPDLSAWREQLRATLAAAMAPTHWVTLERIPLSPNGKVDRRALPDPASAATGIERETVPPQNATETSILALWQTVLQVPDSGVTNDFFDCGGHSLKAMQLLSRIHRELGVKVPLRAFFDDANVRGLAHQVDATAPSADFTDLAAIAMAPPAPHYPLSFAQQRLWLLHQLGGETAYNMPEAYRITGTLDPRAVEQAVAGVIARHEALRTAFLEEAGEPVQAIRKAVPYALRQVDLTGVADAEERARELADAEAAKPFDLAAPPLLRTVLIRLAPDRWVYLQTIHHIVGDGWSGNVLYREIFALYEAYRRGQSDPLPPLRIHYKDFAYWQKSRGWKREEAYWTETLRGAPSALRLPFDFPVGNERDFRGASVSHALSPAAVKALRRSAQGRRTTVANSLLAVFNLLLFQLTKQPDFCVGLSIANRNHPDLENLIGFFVNLMPIRVQLDESMEFKDLLEQVVTAADAAAEHQDYPFDLMVQQLNPERAANRQPLLNVVYGFQNFSDVHVEVGAAEPTSPSADTAPQITPFEQAYRTSKFDLTLFVEDDGFAIRLTMEYDTGLFKASTIQRHLTLLDRFASMVNPEA